MLRTESITPVLPPIAISSSLIFVTELPDDRRYTEGAGVILVRPQIIMLPLVDKMSWATFALGKNVRCNCDLKVKLNVAIGVARIIHLYVGRHDTEIREESSKGEMEDPMGDLLIKGGPDGQPFD
jgi:hypothetical protein